MSDAKLVMIAAAFIVVVILAASGVFQTPIAQVLDTLGQAVRLVD